MQETCFSIGGSNRRPSVSLHYWCLCLHDETFCQVAGFYSGASVVHVFIIYTVFASQLLSFFPPPSVCFPSGFIWEICGGAVIGLLLQRPLIKLSAASLLCWSLLWMPIYLRHRVDLWDELCWELVKYGGGEDLIIWREKWCLCPSIASSISPLSPCISLYVSFSFFLSLPLSRAPLAIQRREALRNWKWQSRKKNRKTETGKETGDLGEGGGGGERGEGKRGWSEVLGGSKPGRTQCHIGRWEGGVRD